MARKSFIVAGVKFGRWPWWRSNLSWDSYITMREIGEIRQNITKNFVFKIIRQIGQLASKLCAKLNKCTRTKDIKKDIHVASVILIVLALFVQPRHVWLQHTYMYMWECLCAISRVCAANIFRHSFLGQFLVEETGKRLHKLYAKRRGGIYIH